MCSNDTKVDTAISSLTNLSFLIEISCSTSNCFQAENHRPLDLEWVHIALGAPFLFFPFFW
jgi:hypothetical protein